MLSRVRTQGHVPDNRRPARGLLDTSVVIDLQDLDPARLPIEAAVSAITMAELAAGPHATSDPDEGARRQDRLQRAEAAFEPLPFDGEAARAYGRVFAAVASTGRKARGARAVDLLIAATALAAGLPVFTRNGEDFRALEGLVDVIEV
ncbi:MAG: type II toxin-antitoxin system VapC family toxin [Actinomycetota bacterium]|nr:type II toxin-antitoxin system VapC family toxin [Actinomycetota bacterium]